MLPSAKPSVNADLNEEATVRARNEILDTKAFLKVK